MDVHVRLTAGHRQKGSRTGGPGRYIRRMGTIRVETTTALSSMPVGIVHLFDLQPLPMRPTIARSASFGTTRRE
jgi:hypothetical protein